MEAPAPREPRGRTETGAVTARHQLVRWEEIFCRQTANKPAFHVISVSTIKAFAEFLYLEFSNKLELQQYCVVFRFFCLFDLVSWVNFMSIFNLGLKIELLKLLLTL